MLSAIAKFVDCIIDKLGDRLGGDLHTNLGAEIPEIL